MLQPAPCFMPICACAGPSTYVFTTTTSAATFVLNTNRLQQPQAEVACQQHGGHLAYYRDLFEQVRPDLLLMLHPEAML